MQHRKQIGKISIVMLFALLLAACSLNDNKKMSDEDLSMLDFRRGLAYLELGKTDLALKMLESAIDKDPNNYQAVGAIAALYERVGMYEKAEENYKHALEIQPEKAAPENNYGRFLCDRGEYEQGMVFLKNASEKPMNTRKWVALTNLGICQNKQGDMDEAEVNLRKALALQPEFAPALLEMAKISYRKHKYMSAQAFLQRYHSVAEPTAQTLWYEIHLARISGNKEEAEKFQAELLQKFPNSEQAWKIKGLD
jgi:type IV pilus assembly protein PilF